MPSSPEVSAALVGGAYCKWEMRSGCMGAVDILYVQSWLMSAGMSRRQF